MDRKILVVCLLLLSGCKSKVTACTYYSEQGQIEIEIEAVNDDIKQIEVCSSFNLPISLVSDKDKFNDLLKQLSEEYYIDENNILSKKESVLLDKKYSLSKTLEYLKMKRFVCE